ncbi:hypothetical protein ACJRO7_009649 [Eucalyptus globulus]|uniref:Late embryogenesis abundant protein LEA-2 subgroup domain-containing protein n=1 Tax=Eucalyptus globulus TaxID=34317 RepID=A0ABD3L9G4_EUCGL
MRTLHPIQPPAANNPASPGPLQSGRYKLIAGHRIMYAMLTILGLLMVIFLVILAGMPPKFRLNPGSSLLLLNISTSNVTTQWNIALSVKNPSPIITVKYTHMEILLSFQGRLALSCPSLVPGFTQGPHNITTVRAEALSTLAAVSDLNVEGLVSTLKGGRVSIDVVAKAKRRLHLGPWWVAVFDVCVSCMGVNFTAPNFTALTKGEGSGDWMIHRDTLRCKPNIITQFW